MSLSHLVRYALSLSPQAAMAKTFSFASRIVGNRLRGVLWRNRETYVPLAANPPAMAQLLASLDTPQQEQPHKDLCDQVLAHRFDLLGSGWTEVTAGGDTVISPGNRNRAAAIGKLIEPGYKPLDWHVDFKSGYHWRADRLSGSLAYGHHPGVDVKVPWELARCQHLPWLACRNLVDPAPRWAAEFRNQVLDFAATNAPGYGVNWMCAMDVAIRAANMLMAYDLFQAGGVQFEASFRGEFHALMIAHGRHIFSNLEAGGNHYLANITGLLFVAAYLPTTTESDNWLNFASTELISEIKHQFTADGANYEASTSYHRLSAEMAVYGTALLMGLNHEASLPDEYVQRLQGMARFSRDATKPNGKVVQIGDNDSGRFFKLWPSIDLDHRATAAAIDGLFGRDVDPRHDFENQVVSRLAGGRTLSATKAESFTPLKSLEAVSQRIISDIIIEPPDTTVLDGLTAFCYPDFGLYGWRSDRFFLSVRCGPIGQNGNGGHAHNDQLAVELNMDGEDWIADPGTGVYTPWPKIRDAYRSANAHFVPARDRGEPASLKLGLFRLQDRARAECLSFFDMTFEGRHVGFDKPVHRRVVIEQGTIRIIDGFAETDGGNGVSAVVFSDGAALRKHLGLDLAFSPGYGLFD